MATNILTKTTERISSLWKKKQPEIKIIRKSEDKPFVFKAIIITLFKKTTVDGKDTFENIQTIVPNLCNIHQYFDDEDNVEVVLENTDFTSYISAPFDSYNGVSILITEDPFVSHANDVVSLGYGSFRMINTDVTLKSVKPFKFVVQAPNIDVKIGVPQR